jgi:hypothetical protein
MIVMCIDTMDVAGNVVRSSKEIKKVADLEGKCAYFPLADFHNIRIFKKHSYRSNEVNDATVEMDIANRLYFALLLFDSIILHCSDPLRSKTIYNILHKNVNFVESGDILFIFSNSINVIESDYKTYINARRAEYERNKFSDSDVKSLAQEHMTDDYYDKVIKLLQRTPYMLKKGRDGSGGFKELIQTDLDSNIEIVVMGQNNFAKSYVRLLNLTLYQLLNLRYCNKDGVRIDSVFDTEKIERFIDTWESETSNGAPFSRHTIIEQLRKEYVTEESKRSQDKVINIIETRLSLLYSKLNCGKHQIIEFHPAMEKRSVYSWRYFKLFLAELADNRSVVLNGEKVRQIRKSEEWENFRNEFLACMAELHGQVAVSQRTESKNLEPDNEMFQLLLRKHNIANKYTKIKQLLL